MLGFFSFNLIILLYNSIIRNKKDFISNDNLVNSLT